MMNALIQYNRVRVLQIVTVLMLLVAINVRCADLALGDYEEGLPGLHHLRKVAKKVCPNECSYDSKGMYHIAHSASGMDTYVYKLIMDTNNQGMSLTSTRRRRATAMLMKDMFLSCNPGDIIETGVFTGGTAAVIVRMLQDFDRCNRTLWAFDSFDGLPERDPQDMVGHSGKGKRGYFSVTLEKFVENMKAVNAWNETRIKVAKGWFKDTVPKCPVEKIAFLRMV